MTIKKADAGRAGDDERYVGVAEVRRIIPISDMTRWRWMNDPAIAFPRPVKLGANGRNFWWLPAIREWQRRREAAPAVERKSPRRAPEAQAAAG
jgi:predicted DNA-binding transcriptional regulator AlpA